MKKVILICGWMASGKDVIMQYINEKYNIPFAVSHTTRPMRDGEIEGVNYFYLDDETFNEMYISEQFAIEPRHYNVKLDDGLNGIWHYGISKAELEGQTKLLILDYAGSTRLSDAIGRESLLVVNLVADKETCVKRALNRGDNRAEIERRIEDDIKVFKGSEQFADYVIANYDLDLTKFIIDEILRREGVI